MLNCKIIFKGVEYTQKEFKDYVLVNGVGSLLGDSPTKLALDIVSKYNTEQSPESLSEMWARLERERKGIITQGLLSAEEVEEQLNPSGQLTDYSVQEEIRYNTYAGIDLTGISANFGKTFGYVLDGATISAVLDTTTGDIIETKLDIFKDILKEEGAYSAEALLEKSNRYKVHAREVVELTPKNSLIIDGVKANTMRRSTIKELSHNGKETNNFEIIDTVINLAIDNVKEQKLSVLGITGVNANTYLTMLGMGIPLNTVSKIFKTPILIEANENSRWSAKIIKENYIDDLLKSVSALSDETLTEVLKEYTGKNNVTSMLSNIKDGKLLDVLEDLDIKTDVLDKVYVGKASDNLTLLSNAVVMTSIHKIIPVGEELFEYAQIFGALRSLPNKKWKVDSLLDKIEKHNQFRDEVNTSSNIKTAVKAELLNNYKAQSEEYKARFEENADEAEKMAEAEVKAAMSGSNSKLFGTLSASIRASFVNRVLRGGVNKTVEKAESVFSNVAVLRIPHVFATYKALLQLKSILENSFAVYNPVVQNFIKGLLKEANIYTGTDELEKVDIVSKELIKFLASNLSFELENKPFTTNVPDDVEYTTSSQTLRGKEAWAQSFVNKASVLMDSADLETNSFIRSLELPPENNGLSKLQIIGDKVNDEEVLEEIRDAFLKLTQDSTEISSGYTRADWAQDLFKYALMGEAMYYEKTGFALIFPAHWVVKYGVALDGRLSSVIPKGESKTDLNLAILKDRFMFQFLKNNPSLVSKTTKIKPMLQRSTKTADKTQESYAGVDNVDGTDIHFDLKYEKPYSDTSAKYLRRYDDSIYLLINTPGSPFSYYTKLTENSGSRFYHFEPSELDASLDLGALQSGKYPVVNTANIVQGKLTTDYRTHEFEKGQVIHAFPKSSASANSIRYYSVDKVSKLPDKIIYALSYKGSFNITKTDEAVDLKNLMAKFLNENLGTVVTVSNLKEYRDIQFKNKRARLLSNEGTDESTAIKLPIAELPPNASVEMLTEITNYILSAIEKLDKNLNYYVDGSILNPLNSNPTLRNKIAKALRDKIGFLEPFREREEEMNEKIGALRTALKEQELLSWVFANGAEIIPMVNTTHTHTAKIKGEMRNKNIQAGDFVSAGNGKYFYVNEIQDKFLNLIEFGPEVFNLIQSDNMSLEEFLKIYETTIKC